MQFKMPTFNMPPFGAQPKSGGANVKTVAVSGSSGLVGSALAAALVAQDVKVARLGRDGVDPALLEGVDAVVHLAGENVATGKAERITLISGRRTNMDTWQGRYDICEPQFIYKVAGRWDSLGFRRGVRTRRQRSSVRELRAQKSL
jgi:hypothetical protein